MQQLATVRVAITALPDVQREREAAVRITEELNHGIAAQCGLRLETYAWEIDVRTARRPDALPHEIEDCDVAVAIFCISLGAPAPETGSAQEFRRAYESWKESGKPHLLVFFSQKPLTPTSEGADAWERMQQFRRELPADLLRWDYKSTAEFEHLIRGELTEYLVSRSAVPPVDQNPTSSQSRETAPELGGGNPSVLQNERDATASSSEGSGDTPPPNTSGPPDSRGRLSPHVSSSEQNHVSDSGQDMEQTASAAGSHAVDAQTVQLSASCKGALERANGMRIAMKLPEVHMEQLMVGLFEKHDGPTRRLFGRAKIDAPALLRIIREVREQDIPTSYSPASLDAFPSLSEHANRAVQLGIERCREQKTKLLRSRHLLYGALSVDECGLVKALQEHGIRKEDIYTVVTDDPASQGAREDVSIWEYPRSVSKSSGDVAGKLHGEDQPQKTPAAATTVQPIEVFYSYSQKDLRFKKLLEKYLGVLQREGLVKSWSGLSISAGDRAGEVADRLNSAQLILLLVSPDYLGNPYGVSEMKRAVNRQTKGEALVVPVLLRPGVFSEADSPITGLQALPEGGRAVSEYANHDEGFRNVAEGLRRIIPTITVAKSSSPTAAAQPTPTPTALVGSTAAPTPKVDSDLWAEKDELGYEGYARTIAALITHPETVAPLTIGIKAPWGAGKTSLMKRVQHLLDGRAELSEENRSGARQQGQAPKMTLWGLRRELKRITKSDSGTLKPGEMQKLPTPSNTEGERYGLPPRITVWFNAWKYQTSEQIWAGMAHCIISQVTARMDVLERELFWLRLHARRVNTDEVRRKVHEVLLRMFVPAALMIFALCAIVVWALAVAPLWLPLRWTAQGVTVLSGLIGVIWKARDTLGEKAAGTVKELVREPDYEGKLGYLHLVESDIREVLNLVTGAGAKAPAAELRSAGPFDSAQGRQPGAAVPTTTQSSHVSQLQRDVGHPTSEQVSHAPSEQSEKKTPLVVFVDDLDRCAPNKVAEVVEAINLFLCGDYPNCIFVLGMEPGMVAAALEVANKDVIDRAKEMGLGDGAAPVGWRFMEKIVQMPVMIPPPTKTGRDAYVKSLVGSAGTADAGRATATAAAPEQRAKSVKSSKTEVPKEEEVRKFVEQMKGATLAEVEKKSLQIVAAAPAEKRHAAAEAGKRVYAQTFSERDPMIADLVQECVELVDGNPRQIKRYVNVFRFYSTLRYGLRADGVAKESELPSDKVLAKFVAMSIQWPHAMDCLRCQHCTEKGRTISRLEYLETESAKIPGDDAAGDATWKEIVGEKGMGLESWAHARAFRMFLGRGESLGKSRGHGLW